MIYRELGQSGITVSAVGLGTWAIGGTAWGGTDEAASIAAIQAGVDAGMTLIDTAPAYGLGLSEELVGKAVRHRRDEVVLATKLGLVWHTDQGQRDGVIAGQQIFHNLRPESIRYEVEQSLRRLQTDRIDLYQTHWPDPTTPIADTMAALLELVAEGKVRAIGVSNCSVAQMEEYLAVGPLASNQVLYNMLDREIEDDILPFCRQRHIGVLSYSSMSLGLLSGKMPPDRTFPPDDLRAGRARFRPEAIERVNETLERLAPWREQYGLDQTQLTIAWTLSQPGITSALVGVRSVEQAQDDAQGGVEISAEDLAAMAPIVDSLG